MTAVSNAIDLTNQVAIVTGGGGGIGRAIALAFAAAGADIVVAEIVPERCEAMVAEVRALGRKAIAPRTDMADTDQVRAMVEQAKQEFGRIDILVNNVGGVGRRPFLEMSERSWRRQIELNLVSMFAATSAAAPVMIEGGRGGSIINVSSIEGSRAAPNFSVYAACKSAMNGFTRTLALELSGDRIRVNTLAPDTTDTPGTRGNITGPVDPTSWIRFSPEMDDANNRRVPLGRVGIDTDCAQAALFLASPMSSYITGITLPVDGGTWASSGWVRDCNGKWTLIEVPPSQS